MQNPYYEIISLIRQQAQYAIELPPQPFFTATVEDEAPLTISYDNMHQGDVVYKNDSIDFTGKAGQTVLCAREGDAVYILAPVSRCQNG